MFVGVIRLRCGYWILIEVLSPVSGAVLISLGFGSIAGFRLFLKVFLVSSLCVVGFVFWLVMLSCLAVDGVV